MTCPLEDVVTPRALQAADYEWVPADAEFLATALVVVPKSAAAAFLDSYAALDAGAVPVGPEGARGSARASPVVPGSAALVAEDRDGYALYALTILKAFGDSFRAAAKEKRLTVRDFSYVPALAGSVARAAGELGADADRALAVLKDQSRRRFEEAFSVWMHLKTLRVFVEAVLRFGVPVDFAAVLVRVAKGAGKPVMAAAHAAWRALAGGAAEFDRMYAPANLAPLDEDDDQAFGPDPLIAGVTDAGAPPPLPFVWVDFDVRADTTALAAK
jgi:V-type H+-transporting ATPase subunit C